MMLAGNHDDYADGVYSYAELPSLRKQTAQLAESKQSATSDIPQPLRNSQTRRALRVKDGTVNTVSNKPGTPYDTMGNAESDGGPPVSYHAGAYNTHIGQFISGNNCCDDRPMNVTRSVTTDSSVSSDSRVTNTNKVQLGDYVLPPDQRKESIDGIKSPNPAEYCDPYETENLSKHVVQKIVQKPEDLRRSLPVTLGDESDVYELATAIPDSSNNQIQRKQQRKAKRLCSAGSPDTYDHTPLTRSVSEPFSPEEQDDYDHLSTWKGKTESGQLNSISPDNSTSVGGQNMMATAGVPGMESSGEQVYSEAYEEPWDARKLQERFSNITDKADNLFDSSKPANQSQNNDSVISGVAMRQKPKQEIAVYEEAWDTPENQKMFELHLKDVQQHESTKQNSSTNVSTHEQNQEYEEPWRDSGITRSSSHQRSPQKCPVHQTPGTLPGRDIPTGIGGDTYESPWDTKKMEDTVRDSLQHSVPHTRPISSPDSPPDFHAPKVPEEEYQEAWDKRPSSDFIVRSTDSSNPGNIALDGWVKVGEEEDARLAKYLSEIPPPTANFIPGGRRTSTGRKDGVSKELAERIDPSTPLDIQKFYHGGITRKQAEDLMAIHKEGSYLIRRSETQNNVFSLSLKGARGLPMHIRIGLKNGEYILGENSQPFPTVPEVIDYYTRHELPVQGAGRLRLLHPIMRAS